MEAKFWVKAMMPDGSLNAQDQVKRSQNGEKGQQSKPYKYIHAVPSCLSFFNEVEI